MAKKSKSPKHKKKSIGTAPSSVDSYLHRITRQILAQNYVEAVVDGERLLNYLPKHAPQRLDALIHLGTAYSMLQNYPRAYEVLTEALTRDPLAADLWYNRSMACRFTGRMAQSLLDIQRAQELNTRDVLRDKISKALEVSRELAQKTMELRGPNFTLEQLAEQEEHFQQGLSLMESGQWAAAGQAFQAAIDMGDCQPQPWGNLGISFMMQERYDEAEAALKRAIAMDQTYTIAKDNLAALPTIRRTGPPSLLGISDPFMNADLKQSLTFIQE